MIYKHLPDIKNIAVCFSGEPRTYNLCAQSINNFFNIPNVNVKYFAHVWNSNSYKTPTSSGIEFDSEEYDIDFIRSDITKFYNFEKLEVENKFPNRPDNPWDNLFYSDAKSNLLKKQYEEKHNIIFDVVVKCRFDLAFLPGENLLNIIKKNHWSIHEKTIYSEIFLMTPEFFIPNIDDVFYYGSSMTMDIVQSNMPYIANDFYGNLYDISETLNPYYNIAGPGVCMYRWAEQIHVTVQKSARPFLIYRKANIPMNPVTHFDEIRKASSFIV